MRTTGPRMGSARTSVLVAAIAAATTACALAGGPPAEESPPHGGLPAGVTAAPPATQVGPVTSPTPAVSDPTPAPVAEPVVTSLRGAESARAPMDSTTKVLSARLDTVIVGLSERATRMPLPIARGVARGIAATLRDSRAPRVRAVAMELDTLVMLLDRTPVDGREVGRVMQRLGARAAAASPEAGVLAGRVARLADQLREQGRALAGGQ